ncbi:hypothetical protein N2M06_04950 [Oceanimonas sp. AH20CE76]|uniref:hypothetical protein n=1 Tax=Oceanimonas sp. AH20CE76 TaxID=2977120 RepID=UPI0031FED990
MVGDKVIELAIEWERIWESRPFENNNGLNCQGAFSLFYFLREMNPKPELVFEIGTWRGFSTWIIRKALPGVRVVCSDPILASRQFLNQDVFQPEYRLSDVEYTWQDFSNIEVEITGDDREKVVVFFDDHQHKIPRIKQAAEKGIKHIIFDDNVPFEYTHESLEYIFQQQPDLRDDILSNFHRYDVFPLVFKSDNPKYNKLKSVFDKKFMHMLPALYESRDVYSWVTKIELME